METTQKTRVDWIDTAKGLGIILVMLGHLNINGLEDWIYSFHMPMFFFLSGYVFSAKDDPLTFLKKRCKSMLIPYFSIGFIIIIYEIIMDLIEKTFVAKEIWDKIKLMLIQIRCWDLWFLACLFCVTIIFYFIAKIIRNSVIILIISYFIMLAGFSYYENGGQGLFWNLDVCFFAIFFFAAGYFCNDHLNHAINFFLEDTRLSIIAFIIAWIINGICAYYSQLMSQQMFEMYMGTYGVPALSFLAAFAGTFGVIVLAHKISPEIIKYIGKHSLVYFALHQSIILPTITAVLKLIPIYSSLDEHPVAAVIFAIIETILMTVMLTAVSRLLSETKLKVLLGKF